MDPTAHHMDAADSDQSNASSHSLIVADDAAIHIEWPTHCKYFVPQLMDAGGAIHLLFHDGQYSPPSDSPRQPLKFVDLPNTGPLIKHISPDDAHFEQFLRLEGVPSGGTRLLFVPQKRLYFGHGTKCDIRTDIDTWLAILQYGEVPPNAVELLHENNGGCWEHTSFCADNPKHPCTAFPETPTPCAYHVCIKLCEWGNYEHFVYARHDIHNNANFVLVIGTSAKMESDRLVSRFEDVSSVGLFPVLLTPLTAWAQQIEKVRWALDFDVQEFESKTGHASLTFHGIHPLPPEKLSLEKDMAVTLDMLKGLSRAATHMEDIFRHLSSSLETLASLGHDQTAAADFFRLVRQTQSAIRQRGSQQSAQVAQISGLIGRVDAQWNIVASLVSQHNNGLNLAMAKDTRNDSILMRRIASVTTIFLPATFMATFFSMMFFHIESNGQLRVNSNIWVYFLCTISLSLLIVLHFRHADRWQPLFKQSLRKSQRQVAPDEEKAKLA